jgi:uncharacterized membrane protein
MEQLENNTANANKPSKHTDMIVLAYALFGFGLFTGVTYIPGVVLAYVKRSDVANTYLASHCKMLISVFWWNLIWLAIGFTASIAALMSGLAVGFMGANTSIMNVIWSAPLVLFFVALACGAFFLPWIWTTYKLIKGFLRLHAEQAV